MDEFERGLTGLYPALRKFALLLTKNRDKAEDLVQETMYRAWNARDRFEPGTNLTAWAMVILRNVFLSQMRRLRVHNPETLDNPDVPIHAVVAADQHEVIELRETLEMLETLPVNMQQALQFVGIEGATYDEAASAAGIRVGTIKSRVARARIELRKRLDDENTRWRKRSKRNGGTRTVNILVPPPSVPRLIEPKLEITSSRPPLEVLAALGFTLVIARESSSGRLTMRTILVSQS